MPGAEQQVADCLEDLTTKGTQTNGHTDRSDWNPLHSSQSRNPPEAVPGLQIDGYFPDTSKTNGCRGNACPLAGAPSAKPRLRVRVVPRRARAGRRTRFRIRVTADRRPVRGAWIRFSGRTRRTSSRGRATLVLRPRKPGLRRVVVRRAGMTRAVARVRIVRR